MRRFVISDIHGCSKTFSALLERLSLQKEDQLYLLGDYIDRGIDSKGVITKILQLKDDGHHVHCLLGNHEWMLMNSIGDAKKFDNWMKNGGSITLESYKISDIEYTKKIPADHMQFFRTLEYYFELDDFYLVHAGFNFKDPDPFSDFESMIWIRDWNRFVKPNTLNGKKIIHGHTARSYKQLEKDMAQGMKIINIDCGCVYNDHTKEGKLCALNLDTLQIILQDNIE